MKTRNIILLGGGAVAAYFLFKKFMMPAPQVNTGEPALPVDTQDAIEPVVDPPIKIDNEVTLNNLFQGKTGGVKPPKAPNKLRAYSQTFVNRVYTIVKQRHGDKANTGLYPDSKRLALYERIWDKLLGQGLENPMQATLGQINVAVGAVGMEGFAFPH